MAVKSMTPVSLLLFLVQSVFLIELVEEEADRTRCESPVERFHLQAVPGEGKKETGNLSCGQDTLSPNPAWPLVCSGL